ncbi:Ig-like domain-containing protein [Vibrio anguillarum]
MTKFFKGLFALIVLPLLMLLTGCNSDDVSSEPTVKLEHIDITASPLTTRGVSQLTLAVGDKQPFDVVGHYSDGSSRILTDSNAVDWHASDLDVVLFDAPGIITGNAPGVVTVHASSGNIASNDVMVNVSSAEIAEITVTPSPVQVAQGQTQQLTAMATYSDGTSSDVTNSVTWTPTDTVTATVTTEGLLSGVEENSTTLTATKAGVTSNEVTVNVSSAEITEITVTPSQVNIAKGQTQQLTAIATYSDGTSSSVTNSVMWTPADANTATVTSTGLITGVGVGSTTMAVTKDGITSNTVNVTVSSAVITAIQVTPSQVNVAKGQTEQLTAIATYSDTTSSDISSSVTWTAADTNTATVTLDGLLTGVEVGSTTVTATKDGIASNAVNVTVSSAVITAIQVTPSQVNVAKGQTEQLTAIATYSDTTSSDISSLVTWTPGDTNTATVTLDGLLTGVELGSTTVTATKDGIASNAVNVTVSSAVITAIQVTPSQVNVAKGQTEQLTAIATYSDTTSSDISSSVTWTPADTNTTTVTSTGLITGVGVGSTSMTVTKDGITSNTVNVTVSSAVITAIQVTPSQVNVAKGQTQQLTAIATYSDTTSSDISSSVTWTPADTNTATVTLDGLLTGVELGSTTVTATKDGIASNTVNVTVSSAVITAIQVTPSPVSVAKGQTEQLTAIATYSDTTSSDISSLVTWTPADTNTITVTSTGLITGVEVGSTTVTATKNGISNSVNVTVSSAVITAIQVTPTTVNVAKDLNGQLTATATYSDGTSSSVTKSVTWMSVDTNTATVTLDGLLTGVEVGSTTVTAIEDGIASNQVNVCADLAGVCIDIFDIGSGTLFTNSPSVAYLNSIGGSTIANDVTTESGIDGPIGDFYRFKWDNANALCEIYNAQNLGGRTNWRLAESDELLNELYVGFGNMFNARSWPTDYWYWSKTTDLSNPANHDTLLLSDGIPVSASPTAILYVSCVSNP